MNIITFRDYYGSSRDKKDRGVAIRADCIQAVEEQENCCNIAYGKYDSDNCVSVADDFASILMKWQAAL